MPALQAGFPTCSSMPFCLRSSAAVLLLGGEPGVPLPQEPLPLGDHLLEVLIRDPGDPETDVSPFLLRCGGCRPPTGQGRGWMGLSAVLSNREVATISVPFGNRGCAKSS